MNKRILIVEDEKNIVDILSFNLGREGYDTLEAYDGATAVEIWDAADWSAATAARAAAKGAARC